MSFTGIPILASAGLFAASAAALIAMHYLRSRPQRVRVVTTLFWQQARSAARPRNLWHRFRYLLTLVLLAAIAGLLAFSLSDRVWAWSATPPRHVVVVLDAGMSMQGPMPSSGRTRFDEARTEIGRVLERLGPRDRLAILVADPTPRVIHGFDQPIAAASTRAATLAAADVPADTEGALRLGRSLLSGRPSPVLIHITDQAADGGSDPPAIVVHVGEPVGNAAILSASFVPEPADPTHGRLSVRVGWWGQTAERIAVRATAVDSGAAILDEQLTLEPGRTEALQSQPIPADWRHVRVSLIEPQGITADNTLDVPLPKRPPITVQVEAGLPKALLTALKSVPARLVPDDELSAELDAGGEVLSAVRSGRADSQPQRSGLCIVLVDGPADVDGGTPVRLASDSALTKGLLMDHAVCGAGPSILGAQMPNLTPLLEAGTNCLAAMDASTSSRPRLLVSSALFGTGSGIPNNPAFAILVARAVRHLAGWEDGPIVVPAKRAVTDPFWSRRLPAQSTALPAGEARVSDLSGSVSPESSSTGDPLAALAPSPGPPAGAILLLGALALLLVETILHARGRIV